MSQTFFKGSFIDRLIDKASENDAAILRKLVDPFAGTGRRIKGGSVIDKIVTRKNMENFNKITQTDIERSRTFVKKAVGGKTDQEKRIDTTLRLFGVEPSNINYRERDRFKQKESQLVDIVAIANRTAKKSRAGDLITGLDRIGTTISTVNSVLAPSEKGLNDFMDRFKSGQSNNISTMLERMLEVGVESGQEWLSKGNKDKGLRVISESVIDTLNERFQTTDPIEINKELFIGDSSESSVKDLSEKAGEAGPAPQQTQGQELVPTMKRAEALMNPLTDQLFQDGVEFGEPDYSDSALPFMIPFGYGSLPESAFSHSFQGSDQRSTRSAPGGGNFFPMGNPGSIPIVDHSTNAEASSASMGRFVQPQTKQESTDLMTAAQIARQNLLIKTNMLTAKQSKAQKAFKKKELTFEEMEAIKQARELEAFKLRVDEMSADFRNESIQEAQRQIDRQLNANLLYGIPLVR